MFGLSIPVMAGLLVLVILFAMAGFATLLRKVGPHEALIVYGIRGPRTVTNGGTVLIPMLEQCRELSLELMSFDVAPRSGALARTFLLENHFSGAILANGGADRAHAAFYPVIPVQHLRIAHFHDLGHELENQCRGKQASDDRDR